jgi:hypothetical protein
MDADRFDTIARRLTAVRPRRGLLGLALAALLVATGVEDGRAKKCGPCQKKKRGKCKKSPSKNGATCGAGRVCAGGRCVNDDGGCPAGANRCGGAEVGCGPTGAGCICFQRVGDGSLCADTFECTDEPCTNDAACPTGSACIAAVGAGCNCPSGTACAVACAAS